MYGHLDKQPEFDGWRADLGPWTPKYEDGKLYEIGAGTSEIRRMLIGRELFNETR